MSDEYEGLTIEKGGRLIKSRWDRTIRGYVDEDVTDSAAFHLFENTRLDKGVTLKDILLLMRANLDAFDIIIGNWIKEVVNEGLNGIPKLPDRGEEIDYLELYFIITRVREYEEYKDGPKEPEPGSIWEQMGHKRTGEFTGPMRLRVPAWPDFHGVGKPLEKDAEPHEGFKKGDRINWGVSLSPVCDLAHLPVILNQQICICDDSVNNDWNKDNTQIFEGCDYTLGQILYGITWELSWHGAPGSRDEVMGQLKEAAKEIKKEDLIK